MQDYAAALAITAGCALFPLSGGVSAKAAAAAAARGLQTTGFGVLLMVTYLAFDGFTSTWQVRCPTECGAHQKGNTPNCPTVRWIQCWLPF